MSDENDIAISYDVLRRGTPVIDRDGIEVGTVQEVLDNAREHIFDGIVVATRGGRRAARALDVARGGRGGRIRYAEPPLAAARPLSHPQRGTHDDPPPA